MSQHDLNLKSTVAISIILHGKHGYNRVYKDVIKRSGDKYSEEEIFEEYVSYSQKRIYHSGDEVITYEIIDLGYPAPHGELKKYEKKTRKRLSK